MTPLMYVGLGLAGGWGMYFGMSGALELSYYRARRDRAADWKVQPRRFLSDKLRRHQLILGTANITGASIASGLLAHHLATGGWSALYMDWRERGLAFTVGSTILYFLLTDMALYWAHRIFHTRFLFRHIHRWHHRYTAPTAFTAMAMHPLELATYQALTLLPIFVMPVYVGGLVLVLVYQNYVGLLDHSGVDLHSWLPWQEATRFHDDHHVHFHVNYAQNMGFWDRLFGTYRREDRVYGEEIFGGQGAPKDDGASAGPPEYVDYGRKARARASASAKGASS